MSRPIYRIGDGRRKQCAMREDGVWFVRGKRINKPGWTRWAYHGMVRPLGAWYDPLSGKARLPK
jgi:hypothetical protein